MKKRMFVFLCLAILCFGSVWIVRGRNQEKNDTKQSQEIREGKNEFLIYTYSGDTYLASGNTHVVNQGKKNRDLEMEMEGSLKKQEHLKDVLKKITKNMENAADHASVLTVNTEDRVYGFYSHRQPFKRTIEGKETTVLYGYLEGVYEKTDIVKN